MLSIEKKNEKKKNYCSQAFLKECTYIEKKVVWYIYDNLSDFTYSSDESDEGFFL